MSTLLYSAMGFAIAAGVSEGVNIYIKRNQPVLVIYEDMETPVSELYYRGVCYTHVVDQPPSYVYKNRKRYYCSKRTILLTDQSNWKQLILTIGSFISSPILPEHLQDNTLKVFDYTQNKYYNLVLEGEIHEKIFNQQGEFLPILTAVNSE